MKILTFLLSFLTTLQVFAQPSTAAPAPTRNETDVKSMFSNVYTNVPVDTWRTDWSAAVLEDIQIQGNDTKKYSNLDYVGIETVSNQIDITGMNHFHLDMWTPNMTTFRVKLVDFGADGVFGGGNDTEHEVIFDNVAPNQWNSLDIPLTQFVNLANRKNIAQLIFSGLPVGAGILYIDNVYFFQGTISAPSPATAAPTPTRNAADVISMFSNAYTNVQVDTWRTDWSAAALEDIQIQGNDTKKYSNLDYVGIETVSNQIDITGMNHFHLDMWTPNMTTFRVKLVDFGADGAFGGGNDTEHEIIFENVVPGRWNSLDIPLVQFANLANRKNIAQLIFSGLPVGAGIVYIDNVFFFNGALVAPSPVTAAPAPTRSAADVISMFSNTYTNVAVDTWRTDWSAAVLEDIQIQGNDTKKYSGLDFVGIETVSQQIDVTTMTHLHLDMWTPNMTTFRVKLVDFGADGAFGGGNDTEHEVVFENVVSGQWNSLDIPLTQFVNLANRKNIAQLIFSGLPVGAGIVYVDNLYFYTTNGGSTQPMVAAPTPTRNAADVISMFSNAYTNVSVDTWRTDWSAAILEDIQIQGNDTKKYTNLDFVGIETVSKQIDITTMTHVHLDMWTPNMTTFRFKLVDFGVDGAFGGGNDTEHEVVFENVVSGQWNSLNIPLTQFVNLANRKNIAQLIFSGLPVGAGTVYVDNLYFYTINGGSTQPMTAAPTPTRSPAGVISMFSNAYTNVPVDTWRTDWSAAVLEDIQIQGNDTKKYTNLDFVGIETVSKQIDITGMNHMHLDMWTPNMTTFRVKLVDFGVDGAFGGGNDTEHEVVFENVVSGTWNSLDIPLTQFVNLANRKNIAQLIFSGLPVGAGTVFIDNVYFYDKNSNVNDTGQVKNRTLVFPNPATEGYPLSVKGEFLRFEVFSIDGKHISNGNQNQFAGLVLQKGMYLIKFVHSDQSISLQKLIVE